MALYAVGDVQGCRTELERLLEKLKFDTANDLVYLVGDLVNRGPDSVGVLRLVRELGNSVRSVLGNHDLNALAVAEGVRPLRSRDTVAKLIDAPDAAELLEYLRTLPLMLEEKNLVFCHAGIYPKWDLSTARACAIEVESVLGSKDYSGLLNNMYGPKPTAWRKNLKKWDRLRFIINAFTRMRYIDKRGKLDFTHAGPPGSQAAGLAPWFLSPLRVPLPPTVIFGHWSALGTYSDNGVIGLDTGCVWGHTLTAVRLDKSNISFHSVPCKNL